MEDNNSAVDVFKLLALNKDHELFVYEVTLQAGKCDVTLLYSCNADRLKKLIALKNISEYIT